MQLTVTLNELVLTIYTEFNVKGINAKNLNQPASKRNKAMSRGLFVAPKITL